MARIGGSLASEAEAFNTFFVKRFQDGFAGRFCETPIAGKASDTDALQ
jgi:hypothetical protein